MKCLTAAAVLVAALATAALAAAGPRSNAPVGVTFDKHVVDPTNFVFKGTTGGDVPGSLTSKLVGTPEKTGSNMHVTFDWIVTAGPKSFTARTKGTWNTKTGRVVMNGTVVDGYLLGAQVHEE